MRGGQLRISREFADFLIQHNAPAEVKESESKFAIHNYVSTNMENYDERPLQLLKSIGCQVNGDLKNPAIFYSFRLSKDNKEFKAGYVACLLHMGANPNIVDTNGHNIISYLIDVKKYNTPDDIRNTHGLHELIMLLFCKGLDIKVLNKKELQFCKDVIAMNKLKFLKNGVCAI
jgi:hypothetical protein